MRRPFELHQVAKRGNILRVRELLRSNPPGKQVDVNTYDNCGRTPLMYAVESPCASAELVRLLLAHGARIDQECSKFGTQHPIVALCLTSGDPQKLAALLENGADIHYQRGEGCAAALMDAVQGRAVSRDSRLIDLLKILIASGVISNLATNCQAFGLGILSAVGRFDAVHLLLDAGADETCLGWTPLIRAVAIGSLVDVEKALQDRAFLEKKERSCRTAFLVAIQAGYIAKARLLLESGADCDAHGPCGRPALFYAIESHHAPVLEWLLEMGADVGHRDDFGVTALVHAVEHDNAEAVDLLLRAGADVNVGTGWKSPIGCARVREISARLLDAGADVAEIAVEGRRSLAGLEPDADQALLDCSPSDFRKGCPPRFGARNPEKMAEPFWEGMVRAGISAADAANLYGRVDHPPVWCAQRFGQSLTLLPDGRVIQIAGEHEDSYDEDFCIYNDVFVHEPDGTIQIFGYPKAIFPPTDFHTATVAGEYIYIVGSLGYHGSRLYGTTPVYRLHTTSFHMEEVKTSGEAPGWIYKHRAVLTEAGEIRVSGGKIVTGGDREMHAENERSFVLDLQRLVWRTG